MSIMIVVELLLQGHLQIPNVSKNLMRQTKLYIRWLQLEMIKKQTLLNGICTMLQCVYALCSLSLSLSLSLSHTQCLHIYVTERFFPHIQKHTGELISLASLHRGVLGKQGYQCQGRQIPYFSMSDVLSNSLDNLLAHKKLTLNLKQQNTCVERHPRHVALFHTPSEHSHLANITMMTHALYSTDQHFLQISQFSTE